MILWQKGFSSKQSTSCHRHPERIVDKGKKQVLPDICHDDSLFFW
jgi:hypothetical protein